MTIVTLGSASSGSKSLSKATANWLTPPLAAQAAGFNTLAVLADFTSTGDYTTSNTSTAYGPPYLFRNYNSATAAATVQPTWTASSIGTSTGSDGTNGPNASPNGGIIQFTNGFSGQGDFVSFPTGYIFGKGASATMVPVGKGNWNHCYMECYLQFDTFPASPSYDGGPNTPQSLWPDWWSWEQQSLYGLGLGDTLPTIYNQPGSELDFMECYSHVGFWNGVSSYSFDPQGHFDASDHGGGGGSLSGSGTLTDKNWHTWGFRWMPNPSTGLGTWDLYLDNTYQTAGIHYGTGVSGAKNETNANGLCTRFMIWSLGVNQVTSMDWYRVWVAP